MMQIFSHNVTKNGVNYELVGIRENLPGQSKRRYKVRMFARWNDGVPKSDIFGEAKLNTAADCQAHALHAASDWLQR